MAAYFAAAAAAAGQEVALWPSGRAFGVVVQRGRDSLSSCSLLAMFAAEEQTDSTYDCLGGWTAGLVPDGALGSLSIGAIRVLNDLCVCCLRRTVFQCYTLGLSPVGELRRSLIYLISTFRRVVKEGIRRAGDNKCQVRRNGVRAMVELWS